MASRDGDHMHPTARRCVWGVVVLWVAGAALVGVAPTLYDLADGWHGWVRGTVTIVVGFLQEALVPTGAVLVGAAVVVQALRGTRPSAEVAPGSPAVLGDQPSTGMVPTVGPPTGTTPTTPVAAPSAPVPAPPSGAAPSRPPSPVPALSGAVPTAGPASPGDDAPQAKPGSARGGRQPRSRRNRATP